MKKSLWTAGAAVFVTALFASTAPAALALPPVGTDPPNPICPRGYVVEDGVCVKIPPPPPPANNPVVKLDLARQSTNRAAIRVSGRATDADQPAAALTVQIRVDGVLAKTLTANLPDPPVATPNFFTVPPPTIPGHGYDTTVAASPNAQNVCVTAVNVGSGTNTTVCKPVDRVIEFQANAISYDTAHAQITASSLDSLDKVTNINQTNVQQSTTISGEKTVSETHGWKDTYGVKITMSGSVGIPLISDFKVTVEGSASWEQNGSTTTSRKFAWSQPVIVPAKSKVVATIAVTKTTLNVPYTLSGSFLYASGFRASGAVGGTFSGVNSHDLQVELAQFNLDGTPAAVPVPQPEATLLAVS